MIPPASTENAPPAIPPTKPGNHDAKTPFRQRLPAGLITVTRVAMTLRSRLTMHPLFMDMGLTAATGFIVLIAGVLVVSLFGKKVGLVALGEYLLLRRVYGWLQSVALLGVGGALPRYVAYAVDQPAGERVGYFLGAIACGAGLTAFLAVILNSARGLFSRWLFGSVRMTNLILPLWLMLLGGAAYAIVYGYYRGCLAMKRANALQLCSQALVPMGAVLALFHTGSAALIVSAIGVSTFVFSGLFAVPIVPEVVAVGRPRFWRHSTELLRYGVPRLPAGFAVGALFALGPMVAAHYLPIAQLSSLLLGGSLLMGVGVSADPLGLILLSKFSMVLAQNRLAEVRTHLAYLQPAVLELYSFVCLQLVVFADILVRAWVGSNVLEGIFIIRLCLISIPFYLFYSSLRSIIDAASATAYNTYNGVASGVVFLTLVAVAAKTAPASLLLHSIAGAQVVAIVVLAWLTGRTVRNLYDVRVDWRQSAPPLLLGGLLGGISFLLHWAQGFRTGLGQFCLIELAMGTIFLALLKQLRSPWLPFFWNLAFDRSARVQADGRVRRAEEP